MGNLMLMASQTGHRQRDLARVVGRMVALHDDVRRLGHTLLYLGPTQGSASPTTLKRIVRAVERARPGSVLRLRVSAERAGYFLRWPKDGIQSYRGFVAIADSPVPRQIAKRLHLRNVRVSAWCEGGLVIKARDRLVVSSAIAHRAVKGTITECYAVHVIPHPFTSAHYRGADEPSLFGKTHIDLDCSVAFSTSGRALLLVGDVYHRVYRAEMARLAATLRAVTHVVPGCEVARRVLNLVILPPHDVLMPDRCPSTQRFLERHLGREHVIAVKIDDSFNYNGGIGGLGCMSSVLDDAGRLRSRSQPLATHGSPGLRSSAAGGSVSPARRAPRGAGSIAGACGMVE